MDTKLTLVIMAAGLGSRFGGDKQLAALGPNGETMLQLALRSAIKAGFARAVLVIRPELESEICRQLSDFLPSGFEWHLCYQTLDDLPQPVSARQTGDITKRHSNRQKPWGTAHALWSARHLVDGPMAVITADDYYGDHAFVQLAEGLRQHPNEWMMVAWPLGLTLSEHGGVNRGLCEVNGKDYLTSVQEWLDIRQGTHGLEGELQGERLPIAADALVSMTCWGFSANIFAALELGLRRFLATYGDDLKAECYLPAIVQNAIEQPDPEPCQQQQNLATRSVRVETAREAWLGVTYPQDAARVKQQLQELMGA